MWIGSQKFSGETFNHRYKLDWSQTEFTILGIKFSCNLDLIIDINFREKIAQIEQEIKQWSKRILTPLGRITILKTLLVAKLNHIFIALPNPSDEMIKKLNTLFYNFIWQSKPDKIKRDILNQDYLKGGLKMIHLTNYIYSLKLSWIRRLVINDSNYKLLFENAYTSVKSLVTRGVNYIEHIKNMCQNKFWTDVLQIWSIYILKLFPETYSDLMDINIWDNKKIKIADNQVYYKKWYGKGIYFIQDLLNQDGSLMTFEELVEKYALQIPFTQFYGIKTVIERFIMQSQIDMVNVSRTNCYLHFNIKSILKNKKGCKVMYDVLNSKILFPKAS